MNSFARGLAGAGLALLAAAIPSIRPAEAADEIPPVLRIDFRPADSPDVPGFLGDDGAVFGDRANGRSYGWSRSNGKRARDPDDPASPDEAHDTYQKLKRKRRWEIALPAGTYLVRVVAGDARRHEGRRYRILVEGLSVVDGRPDAAFPWVEGARAVTVLDGRLTVEGDRKARGNRICFLEISPVEAGEPRDPVPLDAVRTWAYQIQGLEEPGAVDLLAESDYDLLVVEPTRTDWSSENRDLDTRTMVERLKTGVARDGVRRRLVVAYVDIGEAEDWRWYWTWSRRWKEGRPRPADWPEYVLVHDPDGWEGNYPVAYWNAAWKDLMIHGLGHPPEPGREYVSALDEVIRDGFDGIYLDWVEGYLDEDVRAAAARDGVDPAEEMVDFIREIRNHARARNPDFVVIQQNAAALLEDRPAVLAVVDAIAQEAVWYDGRGGDRWGNSKGYDRENDEELTAYYLEHLDRWRATGMPVFVCEYARKKAERAYDRARAKGYVPYCTRRSLSRLTDTPPGD